MTKRISQGRRAHFQRRLQTELLEARYALAGNCAPVTAHLEVSPPIDYFLQGDPVGESTTTTGLSFGPIPVSDVPAYSSLPGAADTLYLDFNGHFEATWGSYSNVTTPAYSIDSDYTTFSDQEQANIQAIWAQVAEDYAPFNINVTTVEPGSFANGVALRVAIGGSSSDWLGSAAGGVGYVNSYTNSIVNTVYVFPAQLANGWAKYVGEASSHEAGHAFGLQHQSQYDSSGNLVASYYGGANGKAPIMGNSYSATRGLWWYGTSTSATTYQDDMAVISRSTNTFGYRPDDYGNTAATATALVASGSSISASGVISQTTDIDVFSFQTNPGTITLNVTVPTNNNLDSVLELQTATGTVLASAAPTTSFGASLTFNITTAGSYRLAVKSQGSYGDVGQYSVSGTIVPYVVNQVAAPTALSATAGAGTAVVLNWTDNATNETSYVVSRSTNGGSSWLTLTTLGANATSYTDTTSSSGQTVSYRVQAFSGSDASDFSNIASITLSPSTPTNVTATAGSAGVIQLSWTDVSGETSYKIFRSSDNNTFTQVGTASANATSFSDTGLSSLTTYFYQVVASNAGGDSAASLTASATTIDSNVVTIPTAPSNLHATGNTSTSVTLGWTDNSSNETGFTIERRVGSRGSYVVVGTVGADTTTFTDSSVSAGTKYSYRVRAFNSAGSSATSNTVTVTTPKASSGGGGGPKGRGKSATSADIVEDTGTEQEIESDVDSGRDCDDDNAVRDSIFQRLSNARDEFWTTLWSS